MKPWFGSHVLPGAMAVLLGVGGLILCSTQSPAADREIVLRFPRLIAASLILIGGAALVADFRNKAAPPANFPHRPVLVICGSVLAFAGLIENAGLLPAVVANVVIAAFGFRGARWKEVLVLALVLTAAIAGLFVSLLQQPMKLVAF